MPRRPSTRRQAQAVLDAVDLRGFDVVVDPTEALLQRVVAEAGKAQLADLGVGTPDAFRQVNSDAVAYARARAAELVGRKRDEDGQLVDNPRAEFAITDGTREYLRSTVETAIEEGWSSEQLAEAMEENTAFSPMRARLIARTEVGSAYGQGQLVGAQAADMGSKKWLASPGSCSDCLANEAQGWIDIDDDFQSGDAAPLAHPACTCDVDFREGLEDSGNGNGDNEGSNGEG